MSYILKDSHTTPDNDWWGLSGVLDTGVANLYIAGTMIAGSSYTLTQFEAYISNRATSTVGTIGAMVYSDDGAGLPSSALGVSVNTHPLSDFTTTPTLAWIGWQFSGVSLTSGVKYHLVLYGIGADANTYLQWEASTPGDAGYITAISGNGIPPFTNISNSTQFFKTYSSPPSIPLIMKMQASGPPIAITTQNSGNPIRVVTNG